MFGIHESSPNSYNSLEKNARSLSPYDEFSLQLFPESPNNTVTSSEPVIHSGLSDNLGCLDFKDKIKSIIKLLYIFLPGMSPEMNGKLHKLEKYFLFTEGFTRKMTSNAPFSFEFSSFSQKVEVPIEFLDCISQCLQLTRNFSFNESPTFPFQNTFTNEFLMLLMNEETVRQDIQIEWANQLGLIFFREGRTVERLLFLKGSSLVDIVPVTSQGCSDQAFNERNSLLLSSSADANNFPQPIDKSLNVCPPGNQRITEILEKEVIQKPTKYSVCNPLKTPATDNKWPPRILSSDRNPFDFPRRRRVRLGLELQISTFTRPFLIQVPSSVSPISDSFRNQFPASFERHKFTRSPELLELENQEFPEKECRSITKAIRIENVTPSGPADMGGVFIGDLIYSLNGMRLETPRDVRHVMLSIEAEPMGTPVTLIVHRESTKREIEIDNGLIDHYEMNKLFYKVISFIPHEEQVDEHPDDKKCKSLLDYSSCSNMPKVSNDIQAMPRFCHNTTAHYSGLLANTPTSLLIKSDDIMTYDREGESSSIKANDKTANHKKIGKGIESEVVLLSPKKNSLKSSIISKKCSAITSKLEGKISSQSRANISKPTEAMRNDISPGKKLNSKKNLSNTPLAKSPPSFKEHPNSPSSIIKPKKSPAPQTPLVSKKVKEHNIRRKLSLDYIDLKSDQSTRDHSQYIDKRSETHPNDSSSVNQIKERMARIRLRLSHLEGQRLSSKSSAFNDIS